VGGGAAHVAVVGAGWAGLAAAVEAVQRGARVTLFEMAPNAGGRARDVVSHGSVLDNGQHICIGAYFETLRLMRLVGVAERDAFLRQPLTLMNAKGEGLRLRRGPTAPAFVLAALDRRGWRWRDRLALVSLAARWRLAGFRCAPERTVAELARGLPAAVRADFIEPLCVAALNTPAREASGAVFLRVLQDALTTGPRSADLLLPRQGLSRLLPAPALDWLRRSGATVRLGSRVDGIASRGAGWTVGDIDADRVIVAASASEAARLLAPHARDWARRAAAFEYQPIVTVYARSAGCRLPEPMLALRSGPRLPAQFVFDRGQLGGPEGLLAFVVSGAGEWLARGAAATEHATLVQATAELRPHLRSPLEGVRTLIEKRATFACTPQLVRPPTAVAAGLFACGDYVDGPYPATLEGAIRSGLAAARAATA
jgi:squalene-associated FAD-dependent desaturase